MTMAADGLAKLIEECGELVQVAGKRLAYYTTDHHPDGGIPLNVRLANEMGDVMAAIWFYSMIAGLAPDVEERAREKFIVFNQWHIEPENNVYGIDGIGRD